MASSKKNNDNIEDDLKQKKVNYDWLKKNNMDIADLVKMARKNKGQQPMDDDDDDSDEWIEEVIEDDDDGPADDLALTSKKKSNSLYIPQFQSTNNKKPAPKPKPGPNKATYTPPRFPKSPPKKVPSSEKKKEIDGSKLLLLQSAEKKITEASTAFAEALTEGEAIVSLLEFMLANTSWEEDEYEEVDPNDWETRNVFSKTIQDAQTLVDKLEHAKHALMGTRPKQTPLQRKHSKSPSSPDSPSKEANIPAPRPNLSMQREPSFREPSLDKIEEADNSSNSEEDDDEHDNSGKPKTTSKKKSPKKEKAIRSAPPREEAILADFSDAGDHKDDDDLAKAKNEFLQFAKEGAALASKLEKTKSPTPTKSVVKTAGTTTSDDKTDTDDLNKAKSEFLQFAKEGAALASKLDNSKQTTGASKSPVQQQKEDDLAKAKNEFMQFAQEGAALASKMSNTNTTASTQEEEKRTSLEQAKNDMKKFAEDGAALAVKLEAKTELKEPTSAAAKSAPPTSENVVEEEEEVIEEEEIIEEDDSEPVSEIEQAKKMFLEAAKQGASLVSALESRIEKKKAKAKEQIQQASKEQEVSVAKEAKQELEKAHAEVAKAKDSFVEIANQGTELMAKLVAQNAEEKIAGSGDSFLEAAKEGAELVAKLEDKLEKLQTGEKTPPAEESEDSEITKARTAFLNMAQEGADLVTRLERKASQVDKDKGGDKPSEDIDKANVDAAVEEHASNLGNDTSDGKGIQPLAEKSDDAVSRVSQEEDKPVEKTQENSMSSDGAKAVADSESSTEGKPEMGADATDISALRSNASGSESGLGYTSDDESTAADPDNNSLEKPLGDSSNQGDNAKNSLETETVPEKNDKAVLANKDDTTMTENGEAAAGQSISADASGVQAKESITASDEKKEQKVADESASADKEQSASSSSLAEAKQSFLAAAKEGAALISQLEKNLGDKKEQQHSETDDDGEEDVGSEGADADAAKSENREVFLSKARASFLAAAKEGAALVSLMESKHKQGSQSVSNSVDDGPGPASYEGESSSKKKSGDHPSNDALLNTSKGFLDAAHLVDMMEKSASKLSLGESEGGNDDEEGGDDEEEEEIEDIDAAKKAFLQFAKEGSSLVSKLESRYNKNKVSENQNSTGTEEDEGGEEIIASDDEDSDDIDANARARFLEATKAEFLSFQGDLNKKLTPTKTTAPPKSPPKIERTASDEVDC